MDYDVLAFYVFGLTIVFVTLREPLYYFIFLSLLYVLQKQDYYDLDVMLVFAFCFYIVFYLLSQLQKGLYNDRV